MTEDVARLDIAQAEHGSEDGHNGRLDMFTYSVDNILQKRGRKGGREGEGEREREREREREKESERE